MFKLFQGKSKVEVVAPVTGKVIALEEVPDKVFASKMMGNGVAFELVGDTVCAPTDGEITLIPESKHAFGMMGNLGAEILVHIGLDTVNLNGEGFIKLVNVGDKVKKGTPVIKIDKDAIEKQGISLTTPMVVTNSSNFNLTFTELNKEVVSGNSIVMEYIKR